MATRPVFRSSTEGKELVFWEDTNFTYFSGFSDSQKLKCIKSLHSAYSKNFPDSKVLEVSTKSPDVLGVNLSAFNLKYENKEGNGYSVESIYQSTKVFESGGPYTDIMYKDSYAAKGDPRLKNSGMLLGYKFGYIEANLNPSGSFYNWLYISTLLLHEDLREEILQYDAFTDIEFNPNRQYNCQAEACALYVSLIKRGWKEEDIRDRYKFMNIVYHK